MIQCIIRAKRINSSIADTFGCHDFRAFIGSLLSPSRCKHSEFSLVQITRIGQALKNPSSYRAYGKVSGIYSITFSDGSCYVGQSVDIARRWDDHVRMIESSNHHSESMNKYSAIDATFRILERTSLLDEREKYYYHFLSRSHIMLNAAEL